MYDNVFPGCFASACNDECASVCVCVRFDGFHVNALHVLVQFLSFLCCNFIRAAFVAYIPYVYAILCVFRFASKQSCRVA